MSTLSPPRLGCPSTSRLTFFPSFTRSVNLQLWLGQPERRSSCFFLPSKLLKPLFPGLWRPSRSKILKIFAVSKGGNLVFTKKLLQLRRAVFARRFGSVVALNLLTVVYASNVPVLKEAEALVDPGAFNAVRFAISAVPFIPFLLQGGCDPKTRNSGMELGLWVSLGYVMQALGLLTSDAGRASFLSMFTVIVVPIIDGMLGAIVPARTWFGALMSILGVAMLESSGSSPCIGDLCSFLSAVFFGIHILRTEQLSRITKDKNILPLLGYEVCFVAFLSTVWYFTEWSYHTGENSTSPWTWMSLWEWILAFPWFPALYTGIFSSSLCMWLEIAAMNNVSATEASVIYGLEPLWGAAFAWFLLGERWDQNGWIGAAFILFGSLTVQIMGSSSNCKVRNHQEEGSTYDNFSIREKKNAYSVSPVPINSQKVISRISDKS